MRRFQAQKIYLRAVAALRWVNARQAVLAGQRPQAVHAAALAQVRNQLRAVRGFFSHPHSRPLSLSEGRARSVDDALPMDDCAGLWGRRLTCKQELSAITDSRVELSLRQPDESAGKWLDEDPGLGLIQRVVGNGNGGGR